VTDVTVAEVDKDEPSWSIQDVSGSKVAMGDAMRVHVCQQHI
jgi:hypothetical protein